MTRCRAFALLISLFISSGAWAKVVPLERISSAALAKVAPALRDNDLSLIESHADGTMKQITLLLWIKAPPQIAYDLFTHPGDYPKFFPNVSHSTWESEGEGSGLVRWRVELPMSTFEQVNRYRFTPGTIGPVEVTCPDDKEDATYRWEFLPAPQGGTLLVQYGYTDVKHSSYLVRSFLKQAPSLEHGLGLAAQFMVASALRKEAEKRSPIVPTPVVAARGELFTELLERGQVAIIRSLPNGKLSDISIVDRVPVKAETVLAMVRAPGEWSKVIPGISASKETERSDQEIKYHSDFSIPLVTWSTDYAMRPAGNRTAGLATDGDLKPGQFEWIVEPKSENSCQMMFRTNEHFDQSFVFRKLVQLSPALEHGLTVAFHLVKVQGIHNAVERKTGAEKSTPAPPPTKN